MPRNTSTYISDMDTGSGSSRNAFRAIHNPYNRHACEHLHKGGMSDGFYSGAHRNPGRCRRTPRRNHTTDAVVSQHLSQTKGHHALYDFSVL